MQDNELQIRRITSQLFDENAYLTHLSGASTCFVVDPGADVELIIAAIEDASLDLVAILNTHGHADHIAGNAALKKAFPQATLLIGTGDAQKLLDPEQNLSAPFGFPITSPPADQLVSHGEKLNIAGIELEVRDTPGHSAGHVVFIHHGAEATIIFGGDVLFEGGIGRTDFPDGDTEDLLKSIHEQLFTLPDHALVLPGHGDVTTIGQEKKTNPFTRRRGV